MWEDHSGADSLHLTSRNAVAGAEPELSYLQDQGHPRHGSMDVELEETFLHEICVCLGLHRRRIWDSRTRTRRTLTKYDLDLRAYVQHLLRKQNRGSVADSFCRKYIHMFQPMS